MTFLRLRWKLTRNLRPVVGRRSRHSKEDSVAFVARAESSAGCCEPMWQRPPTTLRLLSWYCSCGNYAYAANHLLLPVDLIIRQRLPLVRCIHLGRRPSGRFQLRGMLPRRSRGGGRLLRLRLLKGLWLSLMWAAQVHVIVGLGGHLSLRRLCRCCTLFAVCLHRHLPCRHCGILGIQLAWATL